MKNLKGQKNKIDKILTIAEAVNTVKKHYTQTELENMYEITSTSIDRINAINKLNRTAKNLLEQGKIKIEQGYHLSRLSGKRQDDASRVVATMNAHNSRLFVKMLLESSKKTVQECKESFERMDVNNISVVVVPMPNDVYENLEKIAKRNNQTAHDIILQLTEKYIGQ